jgi:hypothetical protein
MAYVTIHTLPGSAEELLTRKQTHFDPVVRRVAPAFGALFSVTAPTPDGLLIINVWEDAEHVTAFAALPEMQAAQAEAQLPPPSRGRAVRPGLVRDSAAKRAVSWPTVSHKASASSRSRPRVKAPDSR